MMKINKFFLLLFFLSEMIFPQRLYKITVSTHGGQANLSYVIRNGIDFVSSKELAQLLSANQFYNSETNKIEIKFKDYSLKLTAKNQFVVVQKKSDNTQASFQIPISTIFINNDVFIPLVYCIEYFNLGYGQTLEYNGSTKSLIITNKQFSTEATHIAQQPVAKEKEDQTAEPASPPPTSQYDIYGITVEDKSNGILIRLKANRKFPVIPRQSITDGTLNVFLNDVTVQPGIESSVSTARMVKSFKKIVLGKKNIQLEFSLENGYSSSEAFQDVESNDILITIHNKLFAVSPEITSAKSKWIFDAVVIDAGHGGKDPGAIGVTGVREKNVNLGIALKLEKLIEKNLPDVKVIYTRKNDEFVELYKRGKIANENNGKLFISIHCNSTEVKNISTGGFEVYLLRPGRTKQAIQIAEFENSVIKYEDNPQRYQKLTDENFILVSMAHSQFMRYSERFSDFLNQDWRRLVEIPSLGVKQAGFYVLVGASMPGVLIEAGFLSNRKEEGYLASTSGQKEIAQAIFSAVKKYKEYYDKEIKN